MMTHTDDRNRAIRIDVLTGWRAVAAYSVLLAHAIDGSFFMVGFRYFTPSMQGLRILECLCFSCSAVL